MPVFVWLFIAAAGLFILQAFPLTGFFLMFVGAVIINGWLILLALLAMFTEALTGRVSRWLVLVPIVAVGGYYTLLAYEWSRLPTLPQAAGLEETADGLVYDPAQHEIDWRKTNPNYLLARYKVPRVYDVGAQTFRIVGETRSCEKISNRVNAAGVPIGIKPPTMEQFFCFSTVDASVPASRLIAFEERYSRPVVSGVPTVVQSVTAHLDDRDIGRTFTLNADVLRPFPQLLVGCGLNSAAAKWECGIHLSRDRVGVWPASTSTERLFSQTSITDQIAKMLSIPPRSADELNAMERLP